MSIYSTVDYLYGEGEKDGKKRGLLLGKCQQSGKLLSRHGKRRFGPPSDEQRALLDIPGRRRKNDLAAVQELLRVRHRRVSLAEVGELHLVALGE